MTGKKKVKAGDLLVFGNQYFLCIGDTLSFSEQYHHLTTVHAELVYKEFFSPPTLKLFHWMVETYYTTYKSVVRLFLPHDIEKLLKREVQVKGTRGKGQGACSTSHVPLSCSQEGQTLIVFPDLRTMFNSTDEKFREESTVSFLLASTTEKQKDVHRREIKKGLKPIILCTYAEIFQDFHALKKIIFVDPHKWYYASQQDPRYKVRDVLEQMKLFYGAELEIIGV